MRLKLRVTRNKQLDTLKLSSQRREAERKRKFHILAFVRNIKEWHNSFLSPRNMEMHQESFRNKRIWVDDRKNTRARDAERKRERERERKRERERRKKDESNALGYSF